MSARVSLKPSIVAVPFPIPRAELTHLSEMAMALEDGAESSTLTRAETRTALESLRLAVSFGSSEEHGKQYAVASLSL